ncbi:MAG: hypothetical protein KDB21_19150, partial [Acidimicrobiales bacterium]|nr:hypothetical protein [Acidimicrobiales bacterium]
MGEPTGLEPHPPKLPLRPPSVEDAPDVVEVADGWAELDGVSIAGDTDLSACTEVEAVDCVFDGVVLGGPDSDLTLELTRCEVSGSDLSQVRIH